jgi:hypothetical protein
MTAILARIIARYVSGGLVTIGFLPPDLAAEMAVDPDVALVLGSLIGMATEGVYAWAKKRGWAT